MPEHILEAVAERLRAVFPGETIYENLAPRDFQRPSNLVELTSIAVDTQGMGLAVVNVVYKVRITTFCVVDEVHDSHLPTLDLRAMTILGAFVNGYVKALDRAPKVTALAADTALYDSAEVNLTLALAVDRAELAPESVAPPQPAELMRDAATRYILK
jgi:hypothetical protein